MSEPPNQEVAVFAAALELPADQRSAYLDQACAGDLALRQQVDALLRVHDEAGNFFDKLASVAQPTAAEGTMPGSTGNLRIPAIPSEKPGDRIGRYKLLQQIGEGGCGVVYMAEQEEPVRRRVALKVIKLGMDTKSVIARFEAERQALALMDHPNIAKVLEAGATETGRPYFVMELVRGIKITDYCDQNSLTTRERLELFIRVCQAIQHAHQKGIIHRDIKPSNILVTVNDGVAVPKVIDFGIAKATQGRLTDQTLFTAFEQFLGTPTYMSPEQAEMTSLDIDTRSDIYSLGVLLYELLTGHTPFEAKELLQAGLDEIRRTIREQEPVRPSTRLSTMLGADLTMIAKHRKAEPPKLIHMLRADLDWIAMKALEKDRARRYETANALAADIQRHLSNEPVVACPPSNLYRFQKLVHRNKLAFAAVGAVVVALVLGLAVAMWQFVEKSRAEREQSRLRVQAEIDKQKAQTEAVKSREVAQFLEDMLNGVGPSVAQGLDTALLKKVLDNTAKRVGIDLAKQPEVQAELRYTLGEVYWQLGDLSNAEAMHRAALTIRTNVLGNNDAQVAQSMRRLSHVLWRGGRLEEAEKMARAGIAIQRTLFGSKSLEVAGSLGDFAAVLNTENKMDEAEAVLRESLATKESLLGHDSLEVADGLQDLAAILSRRGRTAEAVDREELAIRRKVLGAENPSVIIASLRSHANELDQQGIFDEEEITVIQLVAAQRKLLGNEHPDVAQSLNRLAAVLRKEGKLAQSEAIRREALGMQRKLLGEENAEVAQTLSSLGDVLTIENKLLEAESVHREAFRVRMKVYGKDGNSTVSSLVRLGGVLEKEGKLDEARSLYLEAADGTNATASAAQNCLAVMYQSGVGMQRDPTAAAKWFRKSAEFGNRGAQGKLGSLYFEGSGVPKDEGTSALWYRKAADQGDGLAQNDLGWMYAAGRGVPKDLEQGVKWLAASTDQVDFQIGLSQLYKSGHDSEQAYLVELEVYTNLLKPDWEKHFSGGQIFASSSDLTKFGHLQWHLGQVLSDHHQPGEAEQLFVRALHVFETAGAAFPHEPFLRQEQAFSHRLHGEVLEQLGRVSDAVSDYRAAIALYAGLNAAAPTNPFYSQEERYATWMLAEMLQRANRLEAAEVEYRHAVTLHEKAGAHSPNDSALTERLGTIKLHLAELLRQQGRLAEARPMYVEVAEHGSAEVLNGIAWAFATTADPNLRDGTNAVTFAEKSVIASNRKNASYLDTLAAAYAETGQFAKAISIQQESIALPHSEDEKKDLASRLKLYESNCPFRDSGALAMLAMARLRDGKFIEADGPARECLAIREIQIPDDWRTFNARSMLGGSLLGQKKFLEAEPLLLSGYEGMKQREGQIPPEGKVRLNETLQRLAQLYDATQRPDQALKWRKKLAELETDKK
ncbi:MAG TPA: tetratricopeptide repeat protein [Verrucomicrobiae bacterium]|nr:tetratricopeptide repeat protein [Verrucomicrobiae bacterium]